MIIDGNKLVFSTGKSVYACLGTVGLTPELEVTGGFDDRIRDFDAEFDEEGLTIKDKLELAEYMIAAWIKYLFKIK